MSSPLRRSADFLGLTSSKPRPHFSWRIHLPVLVVWALMAVLVSILLRMILPGWGLLSIGVACSTVAAGHSLTIDALAHRRPDLVKKP